MSQSPSGEAPSGEAAAFERHLLSAFATPVMSYPWPDSAALNEALKRLILDAERSRGDGLSRSNVGGWHSTADFLNWDHDAIRTLRARIGQMTQAITGAIAIVKDAPRIFDYGVDGWANVSRHGHYNSVHNHPGCLWSGTYYVASGTPRPDGPLNGRLELLDPRAGVNMVGMEGTVLQGRYTIAPIPGLMVLFPSWLNHLVHPFFGDGERISIAFNITTVERA